MLLHKLDAKRAKLVQLMQKFVQRGLARIFATSPPDPHHWTLNSCFGAFFLFGCIWNRYAIARNLLQNAPNWTQNSCFRAFLFRLGAFRTVSLLHETRCKMGQLVQLMQKFVPQSLVRISQNLRSRSTQLHPMLMFSCVSFCLGAFGTVSLLHKTRNKTGHTGAINAKVRATMSCYNFTQRTLQSCTTGP